MPRARTEPFRCLRVLLVEDNDAVRESLRRIMAMSCEVRAAKSATDAERALREGVFDLVVTDLDLGGECGLGVLACARRHAPAARRVLMSCCAPAPPDLPSTVDEFVSKYDLARRLPDLLGRRD